MFKCVWKQLGSPKLKPSDIMLRLYDGNHSFLISLYPSMPVKLDGKKVLIDIEVLDAQLDDKILLG